MNNFRKHHLISILEEFEKRTIPLDAFVSSYFRQHKAIGSHDRRDISNAVYGIVRWRGLIDHLCKCPITWEKRYQCFSNLNPKDHLADASIPANVRLSFPRHFFDAIVEACGEQKAVDICYASNFPAPITTRINALKTTRDAMLKQWATQYSISPSKYSNMGIVFHKKIHFFSLPEFKDGKFEIQDEGSQLVAAHVDVKPKDHVLDYCAGSGGKTLAFAPKMQGKGQIYLYDIRPYILKEAKKRLKRAGIQNAQIVDRKKLKKKSLAKKMDWILLDVPCTGTGTLRRNPDMKWKFKDENLENLILEQRKIFEEALPLLHPDGKIVYATCSIFPQENERQIEYFIEKYGMKRVKEDFVSIPEEGQMDGFFASVLSF